MAQPLLMAHPENATIEELKQVSRLGSNEYEEKLSERFDQAILDANPEKTQHTTAIGTLF